MTVPLANEQPTDNLSGRLRALGASHLPVTLWAVRRRGTPDHRRYQVAPVPIDPDVERRLRAVLQTYLRGVEATRAFEYVPSEDEEDNAVPMVLPIADCDLVLVRASLREALAAQHDADWDAFHQACGYVLHARAGQEDVYAYRATKGAWAAKRQKLFGIRRSAGTYELVDEPHFLHLDERLDCLGVGEEVVILDRKRFETGLDFRDTVRQHAHQVVAERLAPFLADGHADVLRDAVGRNLPRLRQLASLRHADHLTPDFPERLRRICEEHDAWRLSFTPAGRIQVDPDHVKELLSALCNTRLRSPLDDALYDVPAKRRAAPRAPSVTLVPAAGDAAVVAKPKERVRRRVVAKRAASSDGGQAVA